MTIPALNEAATIERVVAGVPRSVPGFAHVQVIVLDDASTDDTRLRAARAGARVVTLQGRRGLGRAFRIGMRLALHAGADVIVNLDGDGQFDPADVPSLVAPIVDERADFVTCVRFDGADADRRDMSRRKLLGNRGVTWCINQLSGLHLADVSCGFRAYTRETACRLQQFGDWTYTEESILNLAGHGARIVQVALPVRGTREHGDSRVARNVATFGMKLTQTIGLAVVADRPLRVLGAVALAMTCLALPASFALGSAAAFALLAMATLSLVAGALGDMVRRQRAIDEELLFHARRLDVVRTSTATDHPDAVLDRAARRTASMTAPTSIDSTQ